MVLPSLISVSLAPGPYWPAARASPPATMRAAPDKPMRTVRFMVMISSLWFSSLSDQRRPTCLDSHHRPREQRSEGTDDAVGHGVHEQQHRYPVDRPGRGVGNVIGEIGHELDEDSTDNSAADCRNAPDRGTHQEGNRQ